MDNIISSYFSFGYLLSVQFKDDNKLFHCMCWPSFSIIYTVTWIILHLHVNPYVILNNTEHIKHNRTKVQLSILCACPLVTQNTVRRNYKIRTEKTAELLLRWHHLMITVVVKILSKNLYPWYILGWVCEMLGNVCKWKTSQVSYTKNYFRIRLGSFKTRIFVFPVSAKPPYPSVYVKRPSDPRWRSRCFVSENSDDFVTSLTGV